MSVKTGSDAGWMEDTCGFGRGRDAARDRRNEVGKRRPGVGWKKNKGDKKLHHFLQRDREKKPLRRAYKTLGQLQDGGGGEPFDHFREGTTSGRGGLARESLEERQNAPPPPPRL